MLFLLAAARFILSPLVADPDLWGPVRFGQDALLSGRFVRADAYSYLTARQPWINREWLTPDGRLAAYTMAPISPTENAASGLSEGFTDPVATHPAYQRLGLAKALLLTGCAYLKTRGATRARLGTSSDNVGMRATKESAGYRVESAMLRFSKRAP